MNPLNKTWFNLNQNCSYYLFFIYVEKLEELIFRTFIEWLLKELSLNGSIA